MADALFEKLEAVKDEGTFLIFVEALSRERAAVENHPLAPDGFQGEWANATIARFLEAGVAWARDSNFGSRPGPRPNNVWHLCAQFLWAGRGYE